MTKSSTDYLAFSSALRKVLEVDRLKMELKSEATREDARDELGVNDDVILELLRVIEAVDQHCADVESSQAKAGGDEPNETEDDKAFLRQSFRQLRTAYRSSMIMSVTIFVIGVMFLVAAGIRSFTDPDSVALTSIIGGIGVVQIISMFYRNPLLHIARTVSNAQQAKIAVMSYLIGLSFIDDQRHAVKDADKQIQSLLLLTEKALAQLQAYVQAGEREGSSMESHKEKSRDA